MMELRMESVTQTYQIPGGGTLQFNPADPALFLRLEKLQGAVKDLTVTDPEQLDQQLKGLISTALGPGNDLNEALGGVSLFAMTKSGTVLESLISALMPVLQEGAEQCAETC